MRQIITDAGVNLAAIHYHFGSKEELLDGLVLRKAGPVNDERIARLDRLAAANGGRPRNVEEVLEAFLQTDGGDGEPERTVCPPDGPAVWRRSACLTSSKSIFST